MSTQIVAASDTHGMSGLLGKLEQAYPHAALFLHCGDLEDDPRLYPAWILVRGNNDYMYPNMPDSRVVRYDGIGIYMTHSHLFGYARREEKIAAKAKENDCQIALFGHTHVPVCKQVHGVWLINPGSMRFPRDGKSPCYALITIEDDRSIKAELIHEEDWPFEVEKSKNHWFF